MCVGCLPTWLKVAQTNTLPDTEIIFAVVGITMLFNASGIGSVMYDRNAVPVLVIKLKILTPDVRALAHMHSRLGGSLVAVSSAIYTLCNADAA